MPQESVTLEEIENVDGFVDRLEKIELPNQLVAVLHDPLLQKLLMLRPDADAHQRAVNWLMSYAQDLDNGHSEISTAELFDRFRSYVTATKVCAAHLSPIYPQSTHTVRCCRGCPQPFLDSSWTTSKSGTENPR